MKMSRTCFKISNVFLLQSFGDLVHKPLLVDLTVEEGQRLKVIYGSCSGFHAVDVDSGAVYDIYLPTHVSTLCTGAFSITGCCARKLMTSPNPCLTVSLFSVS